MVSSGLRGLVSAVTWMSLQRFMRSSESCDVIQRVIQSSYSPLKDLENPVEGLQTSS